MAKRRGLTEGVRSFKIKYGLVFVWLAGLFLACERRPSLQIPSTISEIEGLTMVETRGGRRTWEMRAKEANIQGDGELVIVKDLRILFLKEDNPVSEIKADVARIKEMGKEVEMEGGLLIKTSDGFLISAERLLLDMEKDIVSIPGELKIVKGRSEIKGHDLFSDTGLRSIRLSNVSGRIEKSEIRR